MTTTDTTTENQEPTPTPTSELQPDDGTVALMNADFRCASCEMRIKPTSVHEAAHLERPQSTYSYVCPSCGASKFEVVVFHGDRRAKA